MLKYQSHKIVEAGKITEFTAGPDVYDVRVEGAPELRGLNAKVGSRIVDMMAEGGDSNDLGYLIEYPDGYVSWSPSKAFEEGYSPVQPSSGKSNIKGYRELSEEEIANMNAVKRLGEQLSAMFDLLSAMESTDKRWVAEGRTDMQKGLMCWTRAIAKPEFF